MSKDTDNEAEIAQLFQRQYDKTQDCDVPNIDRAIRKVVHQANTNTGVRDLVVLAVTSVFSLLIAVCAPFAVASTNQKYKHKTKHSLNSESPEKKQDASLRSTAEVDSLSDGDAQSSLSGRQNPKA